MRRPLQITFDNVEESLALRARVEEKIRKLEKFYPRLTGAHVTIERTERSKRQGDSYRIKIDLQVPGADVVVSQQYDEDLFVALREGFDAARRRLEDYARRRQGALKAHAQPEHGHVVRLDREGGFGFIETDDGREVYFSRENVEHPSFRRLQAGSEVQFLLAEDADTEGAQAKRISAGKHRARK